MFSESIGSRNGMVWTIWFCVMIFLSAESISSMRIIPKSKILSVDLQEINLQEITLVANVSVYNPDFIPIPIPEIKYALESAKRVLVSGSIPDPGFLKAETETFLDVTMKIPYKLVLNLMRDIGRDWDIDISLELGLIIDLPVVRNIKIPISFKGVIKLPPPV